ncbi:Uncharacterized protein PCOAH_00055390 [Plasmodium coatneyi]|uniref:Succinate dehydrogenase assembly factor 4, mitochondrial n=1 Tax=Plasmodium coatneyi TaxID=208452 RepID=A0A1B1E796_9APIC|nr:Uncharacterized protein PCOAH_00055390 [Plasmodium coatneyi]ANQ10868.1 Uncharacterized protein PCOAH_00055390 [Plasmodium coatneyi]
MTKLHPITYLKGNKFFFRNRRKYYNYGTTQGVMTPQILCHHFRRRRCAKTIYPFYYENFSTLERNNNPAEDADGHQEGNSHKGDSSRKSGKEQGRVNEANNTDEAINGTKEESHNEIISTDDSFQEFGYKYEKHEPTMFGDWAHNCRVTDF